MLDRRALVKDEMPVLLGHLPGERLVVVKAKLDGDDR